jgi:hypothetical protein
LVYGADVTNAAVAEILIITTINTEINSSKEAAARLASFWFPQTFLAGLH